MLMLALLVCLVFLGCGGGSDGGGGGLSFSIAWEQPAAGAALIGGDAGTGTRSSSFGNTIPGAVGTVRITIAATAADETAGRTCCVAVPRGTQAFADRQLTLAELPAGDTTITISGYPSDYAPADGVVDRCATVPDDAGADCDLRRAQSPSFASEPKTVAVVAGETVHAGDFLIYSLPFVMPIDPLAGTATTGPDVRIELAVVDALGDVDAASVAIELSAGDPLLPYPFVVTAGAACDERGADASSPCSPAGDMGIGGFHFKGSAGGVPAGPAEVRVRATTDQVPPRSVDFSYAITVVPSATSTTLGSGSTTTTLASTTTSTLPASVSTTTMATTETTVIAVPVTTSTTLPLLGCTLAFGLLDAIEISGLTFLVDYTGVAGRFPGDRAAVACRTTAGLAALGAFNDDDATRHLTLGILASTGVTGPIDLVECDFKTPMAPVAGDFPITVLEAVDAALAPVVANVAVTGVDCAGAQLPGR